MAKEIFVGTVDMGEFFSFWDSNVRKGTLAFNEKDKPSEKLIGLMTATTSNLDDTTSYHPGGWDPILGGTMTLEPITDADRERAWLLITAEREKLREQIAKPNNIEFALSKLMASESRWGNDPARIKYRVVTGNRRSHCLTLGLAHSCNLANSQGVTPQIACEKYRRTIPVIVKVYESADERTFDQIHENTNKLDGFFQLSWQDFYLTVQPLVEAGKISNTGVRKLWANGTTVTQRTWHLCLLESVYPQLDIKRRLIEDGVPPERKLLWNKMDHAKLPKLSASCTYEGIKAWNNRFKDNPITLEEPLTSDEVEAALQELQTGAAPKRMPTKGLDQLAGSANPVVRATVLAIKESDQTALERLEPINKACNILGQICASQPDVIPHLTDFLKEILKVVDKAPSEVIEILKVNISAARGLGERQPPAETPVVETPVVETPVDEHAADAAVNGKKSKKR